MKIVTVLGARPQFIKAAPVSRALAGAGIREYLIHTGQHYDDRMSRVFFDELPLPEPDINLEVGSASHGAQTGRMLIGIEEVLLAERPEAVLVYGDTNSTLAGALAACKLGIPLAHVEAGLRSYNRTMPEEHNRIVTDHCADLLFCPTDTAVGNLSREGIRAGVHRVGDTMYDAVLSFMPITRQRTRLLSELGVDRGGYLLATVHRASNTDDIGKLHDILTAFLDVGEPVIFPLHPRTRKRIRMLDSRLVHRLEHGAVRLIEPVGYLDMLLLLENARLLLTDSGGAQKEAYFFGVPCVTLRDETEWTETVDAGWNVLSGADPERILEAVRGFVPPTGSSPAIFGDGDAAAAIVGVLGAELGRETKG